MDSPPPTDAPPTLKAEEPSTPRKCADGDVRLINGKEIVFPPDFARKRSIYRPHGKWAWTEGREILSGDRGTRLGSGLEGMVDLKVGFIDDKEVMYISKLSSVWDSWHMFFASVYLNATSKYLRPLQGDCIPWLIGAYHCDGGRVGVAQDLPHPTGWREADMFLEKHQKEAVIAAYQKLHDRGILHGDVEYRHMLIGDDGKVTIIDFGFTRVINPDEGARKAKVEACSRAAIRDEMRKVKFMLDWEDSRAAECRLARLRDAREEKDHAASLAEAKKCLFPQSHLPEEPMSEEEKAAPGGALSLRDVDEWSNSGETWIARRYQVIHHGNRAEIKRLDVPRPPVPRKATEEQPEPAPEPAITPVLMSETVEKPSSAVPSAGVKTGSHQPRSGIPPWELAKPGSQNSINTIQVGMMNAIGRDFVAAGKRSREQESSNLEGGGAIGTAKGREADEPAKKRCRNSSSSNPKPKRESPEPTPLVRRSNPSAKTSNLVPSSLAPSASSVSEVPRVPSPPVVEKGAVEVSWEDSDLIPDPTPYDLDPETRAALSTEALRGWTRFSLANARVEGLQSQIDEEKPKIERHRSDFLRTFLMLPAEERTTMWNDLGQPDVRHILGLLPQASDKHARVLEVARVQLVQSGTPPRGLRDPPRPKTHPRVTALKHSEGRLRPPSKLSQAIDVTPTGPPDCTQFSSGSSPPDEPDSGPPPELKAKLEQLERYKEVVFKRAQLVEAKDRALMPPPRTTHSSRKVVPPRGKNISVKVSAKQTPASSSFAPGGLKNSKESGMPPLAALHPMHQKLVRMMWADAPSDTQTLPTSEVVIVRQTERGKSSAAQATASCAGPSAATPKPGGEDGATAEPAPKCGKSPASRAVAMTVTPRTGRSMGKRKRVETEEDAMSSAADAQEPDAKKLKAESCGLM